MYNFLNIFINLFNDNQSYAEKSIKGPTLVGLGFEYTIEKSAWDKLRNDKDRIINGLKELGVEYAPVSKQHVHDSNFCVQFYEGILRIYIIDFDHARLMT